MKNSQPILPVLMPGAVYSRQQVIANLGICAHTWTRYVRGGMPIMGASTKQQFVLSDDLIEWLKKPVSELPPAYVPPNKRKRKGGGE